MKYNDPRIALSAGMPDITSSTFLKNSDFYYL